MSRRDIYYWKCDRPAAFHGTEWRKAADASVAAQLRDALVRHFKPKSLTLSPGAGQGNHLTWNADVDGVPMFVRVENGPEKDGHLAVESMVLDRVRALNVPTPRVFGCDATRSGVPFAWQALERIPHPDLNQWFKAGALDAPRIAFDIGAAVAKWQALVFPSFGPLHFVGAGLPFRGGDAVAGGYHETYADYFHLRLDEHLSFLARHGFLAAAQRGEIEAEIENHRALLAVESGCLVHKDLALWNILGSRDYIAAFIDFDDAISGDPTDDLSLLACFHDDAFVSRAIDGYQNVRALPENFARRLWLHLLRNMIVKAVIRVGAGYFERDSGFFLIGAGSSGADLQRATMERLERALRGLRNDETTAR